MLSLASQGLTDYQLLSFDLAVVAFNDEYEAAERATETVPAPHRTPKPSIQVPKYTRDQLLGFLGIDPEEVVRPGDIGAVDEVADELAADILSGKADWLLN